MILGIILYLILALLTVIILYQFFDGSFYLSCILSFFWPAVWLVGLIGAIFIGGFCLAIDLAKRL